MELSPEQRHRYARHLLLPEIAAAGQAKILNAALHVRGVGIAAEEAATYLTAAGVGRLVLDAELAARMTEDLRALNPDTAIVAHAIDALVVVPEPADRRSAGAAAALDALLEIVGSVGIAS